MLAPLRQNPRRAAVGRTISIPAPVGGLNGRDALSDMDPRDAVILTNIIPGANSVQLRRGYASHATGMVTDIQTLFSYHALNGTEKLFAGANGNIYDVTSAGSASSAYSTSITVNKWQYINFSSSAGLHLLACNGTDTPLKYDGTNWATNAPSGSVTATSLISIWAHKERVWYAEKNSLNAWYLASQAIAGTATKLPLGGVFTLGGQLIGGASLSVSDTGDGMDDLNCYITDIGEVAIYAGTNPASASDYILKGVYRIGEPIGHRPIFKQGGDVIVITTQGAQSLRQIINFDRAQEDKVSITAKISEFFNEDARNYKSNFGWEGFVYPKGRYSIVNVPVVVGSVQRQWIQNDIGGAWAKFTALNANCWGLLNDELYFGGNGGIVYKADTGFQDAGGQINAELKTAFTDCRSPGRQKFFTMVRPLMSNGGIAEVLLGLDVDFNNVAPTGTITASAGNVALWGVGTWGVSQWGGTLLINGWQTVGALGSTGAVHMRIASNGTSVQINGFDVLFGQGGVL